MNFMRVKGAKKLTRTKPIFYISNLKDGRDIFDNNLDVALQLYDKYEYVVVVVIQQNLLTLMNTEKSDFLYLGTPMIIVRKLTKKIIEDNIKAYAENNGYYLNFYAIHFDIKTLNVLKKRKVDRNKLLNDFLEKGE